VGYLVFFRGVLTAWSASSSVKTALKMVHVLIDETGDF